MREREKERERKSAGVFVYVCEREMTSPFARKISPEKEKSLKFFLHLNSIFESPKKFTLFFPLVQIIAKNFCSEHFSPSSKNDDS